MFVAQINLEKTNFFLISLTVTIIWYSFFSDIMEKMIFFEVTSRNQAILTKKS